MYKTSSPPSTPLHKLFFRYLRCPQCVTSGPSVGDGERDPELVVEDGFYEGFSRTVYRVGEKIEALHKKGDAVNGKEAYEVCGACHLPSGAGRLPAEIQVR